MVSPSWMSPMRRVLFVFGAASLAAVLACAQSSPSPSLSGFNLLSAGKSSSDEFHLDFNSVPATSAELCSSSALPAAPAASGAGQSDEQTSARRRRFGVHGLAFDVGGGFNAPIGNDTNSDEGGPFITWGGNLTAGGGVRFSRRFSLLGEFGFMDNKLPGAFIAEAGAGATNGNAHIISLTAAPVIDLFPKASNSVYLTGGGGYYHKSTNFTVQVCCDFYGYPVNINTNSFTSNQLGGSFGVGITHRLGNSSYGDTNMKVFGEARYLYLNTPRVGEVNGLGRTELIPVTVGVRW